ncbi:hypothetical protein M9H77_05189 [Catharanthus roseus]|uniref:Uncharacterized protein n=1 Tax=Catharanthus roseus TaxID=4058 RepID=A0ACC0CG79_CATRO|nr:hypothetical protein M9H77_05189 [Catharanthus roseus]
MADSPDDHEKSLAALLVFLIVVAFQSLSRYLELYQKKGSMTAAEVQLRAEIKQLLKEAGSYSQPSTFAQAAKLKRMAAAKERELTKIQQTHGNKMKLSHDTYAKALMLAKVVVYGMLIFWFWRIPIAAISGRLVQPFGRVLSWRAGGPTNDNVMVGIIPWLIVSTRVSKIVVRKVLK